MAFINIPNSGDPAWKAPVSTVGSLPTTGNSLGDARVTTDTSTIYIWNGSAWVAVSGGGGGSGDVTGPASSTNNDLASFNGTTGKVIKDSGIATSTVALNTLTLAQFASTTSAQLAGVLSDETGSGSAVFATSPTLVTPVLGVATATTINKVTLTQPATGSTLTIADGVTLTASANATVSGTNTGDQTITLTGDVTGSGTGSFAATIANDAVTYAKIQNVTTNKLLGRATAGSGDTEEITLGTNLAFTGTTLNTTGVALTSGTLAQFAATTSAQLAGVISDETGTGALVFGTSPTLVTPALGTPSSVTLTNATGLPISTGVSGLGTGVATFLATPSSANLASAVTDETGTGALVFATSPTLVTPALGTPSSVTLTNGTGLPISTGVSGLGTGIATFLGTPSSANLASAVTDETGSGALVFATSPTLVTPALGTPSALVGTNITGTASGLTAGTVTTNANMTGDVTSVGNATTIATGAVTDTKASLAVKPAATVVATTNQTLSGTPTIDGVSTASGSIILLSAQTTGSENGPWVAAAGAWSRPTWYPSGGTTQSFQFITIFIRLGTVYQGSTWRQTAAAPITIDTTSTTWVVTPFAFNSSTFSAFTSATLASVVSDETGSGALVFATSPTLVTPALGTPSSATLTNATGLPISTGVSGLGTGIATFLATPSSANLATAVTDETGSGALVFATSPTLVTPALGTPSSVTLTNATGLPVSTGISGLGTGIATFLATPSSANLAAAVTDETGSGLLVFATSPSLTTPTLGVASATSLAITGTSGAGFLELADNTEPTAPASGKSRVYSSSGSLAIVNSSGFSRIYDGAITADRTITFPDATDTVEMLTQVQSPTNKTFDNTNTITLKDTLFTLQDDGDTTKQLQFQLSGITTGTTRTLTIPNASTTIVGTDATQTLTNKTISVASNTFSGYTARAVATADGSGNLTTGVVPGTSGNVLTSDGTSWTSAAASSGSITGQMQLDLFYN